MSMRSTRSDLKSSRFPLKLGFPPVPPWKRRAPAPGPGSGDRVRRSEQLDCTQPSLTEVAHGSSDKDS